MSYQKTDGNEVYELLLDSLDAGRTFEKLYGFNPSMTPGADLTI